jgi:hypothetical protein
MVLHATREEERTMHIVINGKSIKRKLHIHRLHCCPAKYGVSTCIGFGECAEDELSALARCAQVAAAAAGCAADDADASAEFAAVAVAAAAAADYIDIAALGNRDMAAVLEIL